MTTATYSVHPTPIGEALIVASGEGLVALQFFADSPGDALEGISHALRCVPERDDAATRAATQDVSRQLDEYFDGARRDFEVALDLSLVEGFTRAALEAVRTIPYGETASYAEVAIIAGNPRAHRAVGSACARTPISVVIPAHRVVRADGSIGEYGGHPEIKRFLLDLETAASE